jgi:SAM-dependent methyltransferase
VGIETNVASFLCMAAKRGVSFGHTCTLGHQGLLMSPPDLHDVLSHYGLAPTAERFEELFPTARGEHFADNLFTLLGASKVTTMDASAYEGAALVHDLNTPIPDSVRGQFDVVFDGGTIEHVFNFPTAIRNAMEMVKVGGCFISQTAANNFCGHGLYQFSPELWFRVFSPDNGYRMDRLMLCEWDSRRWHDVRDPAQIGRRVELVNNQHTAMFVLATREREVEVFARPPQQSDYVVAWNNAGTGSNGAKLDGPLKGQLRSILGPERVAKISVVLNEWRRKRNHAAAQRERQFENREAYGETLRYP